MAKSTFYCSHCGKGNVVNSPINGQKFNCLICRQTNTIEIQAYSSDGTSRLKEATKRQPVASLGSQTSNIHRKKTLLDKNIDLLEKIEEMESDAQQIKSEYIEMTKQLSNTSGQSSGVSEEQFSELKSALEVIYSVKSELESFQELKNQVGELSNLFEVVNDLKENQEKAVQESNSVQHVMNNVAGDVQSLRKSMDGIISSINNISVSAPIQTVSGEESSTSTTDSNAEAEDNMAPQNTTQILATEESEKPYEPVVEVMKPKKKSRSFKAASEKLKSLKL